MPSSSIERNGTGKPKCTPKMALAFGSRAGESLPPCIHGSSGLTAGAVCEAGETATLQAVNGVLNERNDGDAEIGCSIAYLKQGYMEIGRASCRERV